MAMTMKFVFGALFLAATALGQSTQPANSRNIQVATDGVIIATSNATVSNILFKEPDSAAITIGFPDGILSMEDISISDEGYLFGLSVYTPLLCSFQIVATNLQPIGCISAVGVSLNTYVGLSCKGGKCVISGGGGGYTVLKYDRNNGFLASELQCRNCQVNTMDNTDLTNLNYVEVAMLDSRLASLSTVSGGTDTYSIIVDLNTNQLDTLHPIPDAVSVDLAVTPTNYPCVSDFFRSSTGEDFMITACGSLTIQSVLGTNSTVRVLPPILNFVAVTVAVDKTRNVFVVGGHVMDTSYLAVWNIDPDNPRIASLDLAGPVEGTILSIGISRGRLAYTTLESDAIQTNIISPSPSNAPSAGPSGAKPAFTVPSPVPTDSPAPTVQPSIFIAPTESRAPTKRPTPPTPPAPTSLPTTRPTLPTDSSAPSMSPTEGMPSIFVFYDPCPALCARGAYDENLADDALLSIAFMNFHLTCVHGYAGGAFGLLSPNNCQAVQSIARGLGVCGCEKTEWPQLVGVDGDIAKATIEQENPNVGAIILLVGSPVDASYTVDRVWVFVDENNIVAVMPQVG